MLKKYLWRIGVYLILGGIVSSLVGCNYFEAVDVFEPLSEEDEIYTFYGEGRQRVYLDGKLVQDTEFKEWKGTGKKYHSEADVELDKEFFEQCYGEAPANELLEGNIVRINEEDTYNEEQLIVYEPYKDQYSIKTTSLADEVNPSVLLGINRALSAGGLKDYATTVINTLAKDYDLTIEDNVRINGRQTQHITAISKELGEKEVQEIWIDQNTWLILRERIQQGNYSYEFEYTGFKFNPRVDEDIFKVEIPHDANVVYLDNNLEKINEEVTLEEAVKRLGIPIFHLEEREGISLVSAKYIETISAIYGRVDLTYKTEEGKEVIVQNSPSSVLYEELDLGYEKIVVQGQEAIYREIGSMKFIEFSYEDTICDIYIKNSQMSKNELIMLANRLILKE